MRISNRRGKVNQVLIAIVPPLLFLVGLIAYNAYKWVVPSAFSIANTEKVEALETLRGLSPTTKNGLIIPQPQSLRAGGSSRLVISRTASNGAFLLVKGSISAGFMADQVPLDNMLHLKFPSSSIRVEFGGKPVDAVVLLPRTETSPLRVNAPATDPTVDAISTLFTNQTLLPAPTGTVERGKFAGDNGMSVECEYAAGKSGTLNFGEVLQLEFILDAESSAWIEMPRNMRVQHTAIGTENLEIGLLIPRDDGTEPFDVLMFGEQVATVRRR